MADTVVIVCADSVFQFSLARSDNSLKFWIFRVKSFFQFSLARSAKKEDGKITVTPNFQFSLARSDQKRKKTDHCDIITFNSLLRDQDIAKFYDDSCSFYLSILSCEISHPQCSRSYRMGRSFNSLLRDQLAECRIHFGKLICSFNSLLRDQRTKGITSGLLRYYSFNSLLRDQT